MFNVNAYWTQEMRFKSCKLILIYDSDLKGNIFELFETKLQFFVSSNECVYLADVLNWPQIDALTACTLKQRHLEAVPIPRTTQQKVS